MNELKVLTIMIMILSFINLIYYVVEEKYWLVLLFMIIHVLCIAVYEELE